MSTIIAFMLKVSTESTRDSDFMASRKKKKKDKSKPVVEIENRKVIRIKSDLLQDRYNR